MIRYTLGKNLPTKSKNSLISTSFDAKSKVIKPSIPYVILQIFSNGNEGQVIPLSF